LAGDSADMSVAAGPAVVINELHVDPDIKTDLVEFVELYNPGTTDVNLAGWRLDDGVFYTFGAGAMLPARGYVIVAQNPSSIGTDWGTGRTPIRANLIFGPYGGKLDNDADRVALLDAAGQLVDEVSYQLGFPWPTVGDPMLGSTPGTGGSMQLMNPSADNNLGGSWRSAVPTPAAANVQVLVQDVPPQIRQVRHSPKEPASGEVVTITAKVTDPNGVKSVTLMYQVVSPGNYIARTDPQYAGGWITVEMHDDGLDGDVAAQDDVYTAEIPASVQKHRTLVRYKMLATDELGSSVMAPYADDPQANFAYFVYDGVPGWKGAARPGDTGTLGQVVQYSPETMNSLPVYHLIAKKRDVLDALYMPGAQKGQYQGSDYLWAATLVYDGEVYDHIHFRARGGVWRYSMGKNMLKASLLRGHSFQARDDYGRKYDTKWDNINFSACIQQGDYQHRGEQGMFEAVSFKFFNLMGCDASKTSWVHFRVIDEAAETGATQYDGDFWGLYMNIEQMDGRFLDEHGLPDGNLYKMDSGAPDAGSGGGALNNQGPTQPTDNSDLTAFESGYRSRPQESWWRQNINLPPYYGFRCVVEGIHHGDMEGGKNWFFYHDPVTNRWSILPWDLDLTWANNMYGGGADEFTRNSIFSNANLQIEYQNRQRDFFDLFYNSDQAYQVLDDLANVIDWPPGGPSFAGADRAMWDHNPIMISSYVNQGKAGQGRFYQMAATKDFRGMVKIMKDYIVATNRAFNTYSEDPQVPQTPVIAATCPPEFPLNGLTFRANPFADPQGAGTFAAMKWRIGEVTPGSQIVMPPQGAGVVLLPDGASWKYFKGLSEPSAAPGAWRTLNFDDSQWLKGNAAIGYGETFIVTDLPDMKGKYTTIYLRNVFDVASLTSFDKLVLEAKVDDGVNVWINGKLAYQENVTGAELACNAVASTSIEDYSFRRQELGAPASWLVRGTNVIAVQVLNSSLNSSSDCFIDVRLTGEKTQGGTTQPGTTPAVRREAGHYEIEPVWESSEITTFAAETKIPASAVRSGHTYRVRCRMKDTSGRWSHWSAPVQFVAGDPIAAGILSDLRVTEVMYNPAVMADDKFESQEYEFIELKNTGDETLDLSSVSFTNGVTFDFKGSAVTSLGPGQFVLAVKNKVAFRSRYGSALSGRIAGQFTGKLANDGENVALVDFWNGTIAEFQYGDGRGWPLAADGAGHSLVPLDSALLDEPQGSLDYSGNWRASTYMGGSPGEDDPAPPQTLLLNEFVANGGALGVSDWVELYNPSDAAVSLAGWYLSDDIAEPTKYALPALSVASHGWAALTSLQGFRLSSDGEELVLSYLPGTEEDRIVDAISFKAQEAGMSQGCYPDGGPYWFRMTPSQKKANTTLIADVVINELMYDPADANEEYIELYNPTSQAVALSIQSTGWRLNGAVDYNFPAGATIPANGRIVVVGFDPQVVASKLTAFTAACGGQFTPGVTIFGPWSGVLSNRSERLSLEKPQLIPDAAQPSGWAVIDEVTYASTIPWPAGVSGTGNCLHRIATDATHSGNDPANWQAAAPTPGIAP
jgi:hypothetical protein